MYSSSDSTNSHETLMKLLHAEAEKGGDLLPILQAHVEHLASCSRCLHATLRLARESQSSAVVLAYLEEEGLLVEPPTYPRFDYSFLEHPAPKQLTAYEQGELKGNQKFVVAQHVRHCPICQDRLTELARAERFGLTERLGKTLQTLQGVLVPARMHPAEVRTGGVTVYSAQVYQSGDISIYLNSTVAYPGVEEVDLNGLVSSGESIPAEIGNSRIELYQGTGLLAVEQVSQRGVFTFRSLEPGVYDIALLWEDKEVRCQEVLVE